MTDKPNPPNHDAIIAAADQLAGVLSESYKPQPSKEEMAGYLMALTAEAVFWTHLLQAAGTPNQAIMQIQEQGQRIGTQSFVHLTRSVETEQKVAELHQTAGAGKIVAP